MKKKLAQLKNKAEICGTQRKRKSLIRKLKGDKTALNCKLNGRDKKQYNTNGQIYMENKISALPLLNTN